MRTILILKGLPGSGKSTYAAERIQAEPRRWIRISRDDLRAMVAGPRALEHDEARERLLRACKLQVASVAMSQGFDIIFDDTHLVRQTVEHIHRFAKDTGDVNVVEKAFNVALGTCLERNFRRAELDRVPRDVILRMALRAGLKSGKLDDDEVYYTASTAQQTA